MALDLYMKIWEVKNDAVDGIWPIGDDSAKLFKIVGFDHGLAAQISPGRPSQFKSGVRRSYCQHAPVVVHRQMDNASPLLFSKCANNEMLHSVELFVCQIEVEKSSAKPTPTLAVRMSEVVIAEFKYRTDVDFLHETVAFHYGAIDLKYRMYDFNKEEFKSFSQYGQWDRTKNVPSVTIEGIKAPDDAFKDKKLI